MQRTWSEDRIHRWLARAGTPRGVVGSAMHDAAVLGSLAQAAPILCVDQCIEGVHFEASAPAAAVGRKAANRALSDLAATAATPVALLLALRAPRECAEARVMALVRAVRGAARAVGGDLVGGDLAAAPGPLALSVTAFGRSAAPDQARGRRAPLGRDRARPGQAIVLTGRVGGSLLGRHLTFLPRLALGRALAAAGATAAMDVSDGLAWDLHRLARASVVTIELDTDALPLHRDAARAAMLDGRSALEHALGDGEDHELLATLAPAAARAFCAGFEDSEAAKHSTSRGACPTLIGRVTGRATSPRTAGVWLVGEGRPARWRPGTGGWSHGG